MPDRCLQATAISKKFGGLVALESVDLEVYSREVLGLIGPNGSGKTTFFNVLTGIQAATAGKIEFEGRDITNLSPQRVYRNGIARTFQRARLCLELSVFDNIALGDHLRLNQGLWHNLFNRSAFRREFSQCHARVVRLVDQFAPHMRDQLDKPVAGLPMIDRRRIEICRALLGDPRLLLLDEPFAGITEEETRQLTDVIIEIRNQKDNLSVIIVEHEMSVISRITDRCVVLNFGRKICAGSYHEVSRNAEVQKAYLGGEL